MISFHGKKEYWVNLLNNIERKPGYAERLNLDLFRLKLAVGQITKTNEFMEMSKLTVLAGFPAESLKVIEQGFKVGALGTGAEAERHNRLRALAQKIWLMLLKHSQQVKQRQLKRLMARLWQTWVMPM